VDASKAEAVIGLARDLNLHTMVHCLLPTRELFDGFDLQLRLHSFTGTGWWQEHHSISGSLPLSALRDRKVRTEKGVLPRSGAISSTSGKGGVHLTLLKVLSRVRYSPPHSTEGKGMGSPRPPSPQYKVYTSTLCAMAQAARRRVERQYVLKSSMLSRPKS
jgi:hypothetical protein